jgi:hypothetical protein
VIVGAASPAGRMPSRDERSQNRRTGLALAVLALLFFVGVILRHWLA